MNWNTPPLQVLVGDVRQCLKQVKSNSVHAVVTSPPYHQLRDYGTGTWEGGDPACNHKQPLRNGTSSQLNTGEKLGYALDRPYTARCAKCGAQRLDSQIGLEEQMDCGGWLTKQPCGECFICTMVAVFEEVRRVLRHDGTLWLNIGDSYAAKRTYQVADSKHKDVGNQKGSSVPEGLKPKDKNCVPQRLALALQAAGWWLRSECLWVKPNVLPASVEDRPTPNFEQVWMLTKSAHYYYDQYAVMEPVTGNTHSRGTKLAPPKEKQAAEQGHGHENWTASTAAPVDKRKLRTTWEIPCGSYSGEHHATFPVALPRRCILLSTSAKGCCPKCGKGWVRLVEKGFVSHDAEAHSEYAKGSNTNRLHRLRDAARAQGMEYVNKTKTLGWKQACSCPPQEPVACCVLDPFMGSGTTGIAARNEGRHFIGIELNPKYVELAMRRLDSANAQQRMDLTEVNEDTESIGSQETMSF